MSAAPLPLWADLLVSLLLVVGTAAVLLGSWALARWGDFDDFEQRMMRPTYAEHRIDAALLARVRTAFAPHARADGAHFARPMHVRLLRRR